MSALGDAIDGSEGVSAEVSSYMSDKAKQRWSRARAAQAMKEAMSGGEPHPLFPTEPGESIPQIDWINLARFEKRGTVDCPRVFAAAELVGLDDIANMYGGGSYELRGRCSGSSGQPGPMVRRQRVTIDGPSIPFTGEDAPAEVMAQPVGGTPMDPVVMFMTMMKESAAEARAAGERQNAMLIAMMTQSAQQQQASMQAMASIMAAAMQQGGKGPDLAGLLTAFAAMSSGQLQAVAQFLPKGESRDPIESIGKLVEVAKAIKGDEDSLTSLMAGFGQAANGIAELERAAAAARAAQNGQPAQQQQQQQQQQAPAQQQEQQQQQTAQQNGQNGHAQPAAAPAMRRPSEAESLG